ncbi:MAG TPA: cbb3-type cytochrome c oxidase subunit II [Candidatus Udaeobacter sp.]|nr:cbb3-type cytochrome c oxidase subunit II [Candidatus Udaeobacter sp.]
MKGLAPLFLGIFGTFAFSWIGLTVIPTWQIGHLNPESDEEGTDIYPRPQSGMFQRGAHVYAANGCVYCHSQQVRADYIADDIERKWGDRRSAPRDYIFDRPVFLGKMRMGQDLANIGARAPAPEESPAPAGAASPAAQGAAASPAFAQAASPSPAAQGAAVSSPSSPPASSPATAPATSPAIAASPNASPPPGQRTGVASPSPGQMANTTPGGSSPVAPSAQTPGAPWPIQTAGLPPMYSAAWHHVHLYAPRSINPDSNMPSYRFLYEKRRIAGERSAESLQLSGPDAPPDGWEVVPTYDAKCVVAYLMGLNQSHPLKEVRSVGGAPATGGAPSPAAGAPPAPAAGGSPAAPK